MITWVTVWVLTATMHSGVYGGTNKATYQLQYASQKTCLLQVKNHPNSRCNFQQIPIAK